MKQQKMTSKAMMQILCMILFLPLMISCSMRESGRTNTEETFKNPPHSGEQLVAGKRSFWNEGTYTRFPEWVLSDTEVPEGQEVSSCHRD